MAMSGRISAVAGLLLFGTANSLLAKIMYQVKGVGADGHEKEFRKPLLATALMFVAMALALPVSFILERRQKRRAKLQGAKQDSLEPLLVTQDADRQPSSSSQPKKGRSHLRDMMLVCVPTAFDLCATVLLSIGLLYCTASVAQIMRGAEMIFAAFLAVTMLHRSLNRLHAAGIALCTVGIAVVGASRLLAGKGGGEDSNQLSVELLLGGAAEGGKQAVVGMVLILVSQLVQASQITVEDWLMADHNMHPLKVVGYEGVIGAAAMLLGVLPLAQLLPGQEGGGLHEDTWDSLALIRSSRPVQLVLGLNTFTLLAYNIAGMAVTENVGGAARTVLETVRTLVVWVTGLALFYTVGHHQIGEGWDGWSWLQALGFAVVAAGTLVYERGQRVLDREEEEGRVMHPRSNWAVLKSTMGIGTGHRVARRRFKAAVGAVLASMRMEAGASSAVGVHSSAGWGGSVDARAGSQS